MLDANSLILLDEIKLVLYYHDSLLVRLIIFFFRCFMCILLLLERIYWLLFVYYLIGCKNGFGCSYVCA
jgi:hypothetical protein